jgi:hypothetical protein
VRPTPTAPSTPQCAWVNVLQTAAVGVVDVKNRIRFEFDDTVTAGL